MEKKARKEEKISRRKVVTKKVTVHKYTKQFSEEDSSPSPSKTAYRDFGEVRKFIRDMKET